MVTTPTAPVSKGSSTAVGTSSSVVTPDTQPSSVSPNSENNLSPNSSSSGASSPNPSAPDKNVTKPEPLSEAERKQKAYQDRVTRAADEAKQAKIDDIREYGRGNDWLEAFLASQKAPLPPPSPAAASIQQKRRRLSKNVVLEEDVEATRAMREGRIGKEGTPRERLTEPHIEEKGKFNVKGLGLTGGVLAAYLAAHGFSAAFEAYMERRVQGLMIGDKDSKLHSLQDAGKAFGSDMWGAAKEVAWNLVPFYTSIQEAKEGNYLKAIGWAALDAAGVAATVLSFGTMFAPAEGMIYAAKVAGGVAKVAAGANIAVMGYEGATQLYELNKFLHTKEGAMYEEAIRKEMTQPGGLTKADVMAMEKQMTADTAAEIKKGKENLAANRAGLKTMSPTVIAGNDHPAPSGRKPEPEPPAA